MYAQFTWCINMSFFVDFSLFCYQQKINKVWSFFLLWCIIWVGCWRARNLLTFFLLLLYVPMKFQHSCHSLDAISLNACRITQGIKYFKNDSIEWTTMILLLSWGRGWFLFKVSIQLNKDQTLSFLLIQIISFSERRRSHRYIDTSGDIVIFKFHDSGVWFVL
jgi:hypothetical protein